eukprot:scaffold1573_cov68-Attheya_sp.AAC.2
MRIGLSGIVGNPIGSGRYAPLGYQIPPLSAGVPQSRSHNAVSLLDVLYEVISRMSRCAW